MADRDWITVSSALQERGETDAALHVLEAATEGDPSAALLVALGDVYQADW